MLIEQKLQNYFFNNVKNTFRKHFIYVNYERSMKRIRMVMFTSHKPFVSDVQLTFERFFKRKTNVL